MKTKRKEPIVETSNQADTTATKAVDALRNFSIYTAVGIHEVAYVDPDFQSYVDRVALMSPADIALEGKRCHVAVSPSKNTMIDRLENKYLEHRPHELQAVAKARAAARELQGPLEKIFGAGDNRGEAARARLKFQETQGSLQEQAESILRNLSR